MSIKKKGKDLDSFVEEYLKKSENMEPNQVYNIKDENNPYELQYYQLIEYMKFRNELNTYISGWSLSEDSNRTVVKTGKESKLVQDKYCLIDKKWIKKWRKHVGYEEIKQKFKISENRAIDDDENYNWIIPVIEKNSKDNLLIPLDNNEIYKEHEVIAESDFELINKQCYRLFSIGSQKTMDITNYKLLPVQFLKEKYIVIINYNIFWIVFKEKKTKTQFEIIVKFETISDKKRALMDDFTHKNINEWVNEIGFNLFSDLQGEKIIHDCKLVLINKTLKYKSKDNPNTNNLNPNLQNNRYELLNENKIISEDNLNLIQTEIMNNLQKFNYNTRTLLYFNKKTNLKNKDNNQENNEENNIISNQNINNNDKKNNNNINNENYFTNCILPKINILPQDDH